MELASLNDRRVQLEHITRTPKRPTKWKKQKLKTMHQFDGNVTKFFTPTLVCDFPLCIATNIIQQLMMELRLTELNKIIAFNDKPDILFTTQNNNNQNITDKLGQTIYTKDLLLRNNRLEEQARLVDILSNLLNNLELSQNIRNQRKVRKIIIPNNEYPDYNFMGLIIGPKGCNHKRLELESGAQISVRGRGTQNDVKRMDHQSILESKMPLHVHITADSQKKVDAAVALLEPLLDPTHPAHEDYRKTGLQQLATVSQTSDQIEATATQLAQNRANAICPLCNEQGHYRFECSYVQSESFDRVQLVCGFCGDHGHITTDCLQAKAKGLTPTELARIALAQVPKSNINVSQIGTTFDEFNTLNYGYNYIPYPPNN